jgi:hypothetical protein
MSPLPADHRNRAGDSIHWTGRTLIVLLVGGITLALSAGCPTIETKPPTNDFRVDNETDTDLFVTIQNVPDWPDREQSRPVRAGILFFFSWEASLGDCYGSGVVATAPDGTEVARLDGPVCDGDKWIFGADGSIVLEEAPR